MAANLFNVQTFGAVGDGTTDDTAKIQLALAAAESGGAVYFPGTSGGYLINSSTATSLPLTSNLRVYGDGPGSLIINGSASADIFQVNGAYGNIEIDHLRFTTRSGVTATGGWVVNLTQSGALWVSIHDIICDPNPGSALWGGIASTATSGSVNNVVVD